jgi:hypothetical protein
LGRTPCCSKDHNVPCPCGRGLPRETSGRVIQRLPSDSQRCGPIWNCQVVPLVDRCRRAVSIGCNRCPKFFVKHFRIHSCCSHRCRMRTNYDLVLPHRRVGSFPDAATIGGIPVKRCEKVRIQRTRWTGVHLELLDADLEPWSSEERLASEPLCKARDAGRPTFHFRTQLMQILNEAVS